MSDSEAGEDWQIPPPDVLLKAGYVLLSRRERRIQSRPRFGQCFWVDFPRDAYDPEFVGEHPGIVVRAPSKLDHDTCVIVPLTTRDPAGRPHVHQIINNPNPVSAANGAVSYAICDHLYTVNNCRLRPILDANHNPVHKKLHDADLQAILSKIRAALPLVFNPETSDELVQQATAAEPATPAVPRRERGPRTLSLPAPKA